MWNLVLQRLNQDVQIDKLWVRTKNGEATDAFFFNGDGVMKIRKS